VFVDAAPSRGDDYIMPDLAHDTRHVRATASGTAMHKHTADPSRLDYRLELQGAPDGVELA